MTLNPWMLLGAAVVWALSLFVVGKWQRTDGANAERVVWQKKDNDELRAANKKIKELQEAARKQEQKHADEMAKIGADHAKEKAANEVQRRRDQAAIRDGAIKLRIASSRICTGGSASPETSSSSSGGNGPATVELPPEITSDLFDLANDADQVADQLRSCQRVIESDRAVSP